MATPAAELERRLVDDGRSGLHRGARARRHVRVAARALDRDDLEPTSLELREIGAFVRVALLLDHPLVRATGMRLRSLAARRLERKRRRVRTPQVTREVAGGEREDA